MSLLIIGGVWFVLSLGGFAYTDSDANACHNAWIAALSDNQCTAVVFWNDVSKWCMVGAGIIAILGAIQLATRDRSNPFR